METVAIISVLLTLVEKLLPKLTELANNGVITKEQQEQIRARYDKLAGNMDEAFGGDHWKVRPDPVAKSGTKKGSPNT